MSSFTRRVLLKFKEDVMGFRNASVHRAKSCSISEGSTYSPLCDCEEVVGSKDSEIQFAENIPEPLSARYKTFPSMVMLAIFALCGGVALVYILATLLNSSSTSAAKLSTTDPMASPCFCGTSVAEAISLNCQYVAMGSAWLPPHCRDEELELEFEQLGPNTEGTWNYYADENLTEKLTSDQVAVMGDGHGRYYTTWEWHVVHCLFYWRKVHRKQNNGEMVVESRFNQEKHIMHCAKLILGSKDGHTTSQIFLGDNEEDNSAEKVHWDNFHEI